MTKTERKNSYSKAVTAILTATFLCQQFAWAGGFFGDTISNAIERLDREQCYIFAPAYIKDRQSSKEDLVEAKQALDDAASIKLPARSASDTDSGLVLKGPGSSSGGNTVNVGSSVSTIAQDTDIKTLLNDATALAITTQAGDVIHYVGQEINWIERPDGTTFRSLVLGPGNELRCAEITYENGARQIVNNGKICWQMNPDGTALDYGEDGLLKSIMCPDGTVAECSYVKDDSGRIIKSVLIDSQKTVFYDDKRMLNRVEYATGETVEYNSGVISSLTTAKGRYLFQVQRKAIPLSVCLTSPGSDCPGSCIPGQTDPDETIIVRLSYFIDNNGYRMCFDGSGRVVSVTSPKKTIMTISETGVPETISGKDGLLLTFDEFGRVQESVKGGSSLIYRYEIESAGGAITIIQNDDGLRGRYDPEGDLIGVESEGFTVTQTIINSMKSELLALEKEVKSVSANRKNALLKLSSAKSILRCEEKYMTAIRPLYDAAMARYMSLGFWQRQAYWKDVKLYVDMMSICRQRLDAARSAYNYANSDLSRISSREAELMKKASLVRNEISRACGIYAAFSARIDAYDYTEGLLDVDVASVQNNIPALKIVYCGDRSLKEVISRDGVVMTYEKGMPSRVIDGSREILYGYLLDNFGSIENIIIDKDGIERIYDRFGNLSSLNLDASAKIVCEGGSVRQIQKADGTIIKDITFRDSGELDGALIAYPDGSLALYDDAELLRIINASGSAVDLLDGRIRTVTLADGSAYGWSYIGEEMVIDDRDRQETRAYREGRLIRLEELAGSRLTMKYYYGSTGNLASSEVCKGSDVLYAYTYTYDDGLTLVHDEDGNIQAYTKDKKLSYIVDPKGRKYSYTYVGKSEGRIEVYFPSGVKARYDAQGAIVDITEYDGSVIKDIKLAADNKTPEDLTYIKEGVTYKVRHGVVTEVLGKDDVSTKYYDNGFIKSITDALGEATDYRYYVEDNMHMSTGSALLAGASEGLSIYEKNSAAHLVLSDTSFKFGTGTDGAKRISSDETIAAGEYNFTSLTIDSGKTLTVAPGAVINILGTASVNGMIFCGGTFNINAYELNIASGASITGAVSIKCDTINNAGLVTGNACLTGVGGFGAATDDNFGNYVGGSHGASGSASATFRGCDIQKAIYRASLGNYGLPAYANVYLCVNGSWTCIASYGGSGDSGVAANTTGWSNVTGMMMTGQSLNGDCVCSSYALYEMQAIIGTPMIEYASGNPGIVNTTASMPTATQTHVANPSSGIFESNVIELNALTLGELSWNQETPDGTAITFQTRTGDTVTVDDAWTDWSGPLADPDGSMMSSPGKRYMQYRINMSTTDTSVTPTLDIGMDSPIIFSYERSPFGSSELLDVGHVTSLHEGVLTTYDRDSWGSVLPDPVFDIDIVEPVISGVAKYILNDTQKEIYLRDSVIISELTAITGADGTVTEYCQGQISKISRPDGTVITDIVFDDDNDAQDYTYYKDGNAYEVRDDAIYAVTTSSGERIQYYSYGLVETRTLGGSITEYKYGCPASESYSAVPTLGSGSSSKVSLYEDGITGYLALSDTSFKFGTGTDGAKRISSDETIAAGEYNFTSLTIDSGKTLTVAPGAVINILGTASVNGMIFCGGTFNINAYELNIASGASITGAVSIKCDTINNAGLVTGNACLTGALAGDANNADRDDSFSGESHGFRLNVSGSGGATPVITFPAATHVSCIRAAAGGDGNAGHGEFFLYVRVNGVWQYAGVGGSGTGNPGWSFFISGATHYTNGTAGWDNVDAIKAVVSAYGAGGVGRAYMFEMQAIIGAPTIEYVSGNPGIVNTTESMPVATQKQPVNPSSGTFESNVIELNALTLGELSWSQHTPDGTAITFQTRTGDTATVDDAWTDWSGPLTDPDGSMMSSPGKRYMQYRINMSTTDTSVTPMVVLDPTHHVDIDYTKISNDPLDPYVKIRTSGISKTYNRNGVNVSDLADIINADNLRFDPAYSDSLKDDISGYKLSDAQKIITIYDEGNDIPVEIVTAGQSITYFEDGLAAKVVDKYGATQVVYTYDSDKNVIDVEFADARSRLADSYEKAVSEITTQRELALERLDKIEKDNLASIESQSKSAQSQIDSERQRLNVQMSIYDAEIYDLSAFTSAFAELDGYQSRLNQQTRDAYAELAAQVADARARIEADAGTAMADLIANDYNKILGDIVQKESSPIIYHYYRKVLGRDPGENDLAYWTSKARSELATITPEAITQYLLATEECAASQTRKENIVANISEFFTQYLAALGAEKELMLASVGLAPDDAVSLEQSDVDSILAWLDGQSLHFGDSAIESVVSMLKSSGLDRSFEDIGASALKVDILTGVITKDTDGDLTLSMYSMRKAAASSGLALSSQKIDYGDLKDGLAQGGIITHIDGKHYVTVTSIDDTAGTITYIDSTVGESGQAITITKAEFMETWKGYAMSKEPAAKPAKELNVTQEKNVRGSGWWSDFWKGIVRFFQKIAAPIGGLLMMLAPANPVLGGIGAVLTALNVVVQTVSFVVHTGTLMDVAWSAVTAIGSAIGSIVLPGIFDGVNHLFQSIGTMIPVVIKDVFTSCLGIFNPITTAVKGISTGIGTIFNPVLGEAVTELITANVIKIGVELGSSFLFNGMGLDPSLSSIGSALFTGAVSGMMIPDGEMADIVGQALRYGTIAGIDELGEAVDLDPDIMHLAGMMAGSLVGGSIEIDGSVMGYDEIMRSIAPNIAGECAYIGITDIGELLGVDPRISYLAGAGLRSALGPGASDISDPMSVWGSIQDGLLRGATSIALEWSAESIGLSPLVASLTSAAIAGGVEAMLMGQSPIKGIFDTYFRAGTGLLTLGGDGGNNPWLRASYIAQVLDFSDIIEERGIEDALKTYAAGFLQQTAINEIWEQGGIADLLSNPNQVEITTDRKGQTVKRIYTMDINSESDKSISNYIDLSPTTNLLMGFREGNVITHCEFVIGPDGRPQLKNGEREMFNSDGKTVKRKEIVKDFEVVKLILCDNEGNVIEEVQSTNSGGIKIDSNGLLLTGAKKNHVEGVSTIYENGHVTYLGMERSFMPSSDEINMLLESDYSVDDIMNFKVLYSYYSDGMVHAVSAKIYDNTGNTIKVDDKHFVLMEESHKRVWETAIKLASEADPYTMVSIDREHRVAQVDMKLRWLADPPSIYSAEPSYYSIYFPALELSKYIAQNDANWYTAVQDAVPVTGALIANHEADFVYIPGINTDGLTLDQLVELKNSLETTKSVVVCHSAGTDVGIKEMFIEKVDKYILLSPRMGPEALKEVMKQTGTRPDQVIVVTTRGDLPNWPMSYNNYGDKLWTSVYIDEGPGIGSIMSGSSHETPIDGWINNTIYSKVFVNGELNRDVTLGQIYKREVKK